MEIKAGYKHTDVGVIPEDWNVRLLDDLSEKVTVGIASAATHAYRPQGIPLLRNQNIKKGYLQDDDLLFIHKEYEAIYKNKRLRTGDLLTARTGYPGTTCIVPPKYDGAQCFTTIITRLKKNEINSNYLCHYINSEYGLAFIEKSKIGGGQKNIGVGIFQGMPIPIPSPAEQESIAEALSDADALIDALEQLIAKKRQVKHGAMEDLLSGKRRLSKFVKKNGYKPTEIGLIPDDWEIVSVGDISVVGRGRVISHKEIDKSLNRAYPVYSSQTSNNGVMGYIDTFDFEGEYITWTTDGANAGTVFYRDGKFNCTNVCGTIKLMKDDHYFVSKALSRFAYKHVSRHLGNPKIMNDVMKKVKFPIPPNVEEQTAITEILSDMDAEITALEAKLAKARQVKQGMMQELLTGRIRLV